jgi:hypothetical protein
MPGPALMIDLAPPELDPARQRVRAGELAERLSQTGAFKVDDVRREAPDGGEVDLMEVGRVVAEWAQPPGPALDAETSYTFGERVAETLVATIRPWVVDASPEVLAVVVRLGDTTLQIDANGASTTEVVALARAYAVQVGPGA